MRQFGSMLLVLAICLAVGVLAVNAQDKVKGGKAPAKKEQPSTKKAPPKKAPPKEEPAEEPAAEEPADEEPADEEPADEEPAAKAKPAAENPFGDEPGEKEAEAEEEPDMKTISYAMGVNLAQRIAANWKGIDADELTRGMLHALKGEKLEIESEDIPKYLSAYEKVVVRLVKEEGEDYLAANKKKKGVKTTATGLQYRVLTAGEGDVSPKKGDLVTAHYKGTFVDGTPFDSSYERNEPIDFELGAPNSVIAGWTEALQLMKIGDKFELVLPPKLAYGEDGRPGAIPPHAVLVFEVELLKIGAVDGPGGEEAPEPKEVDEPAEEGAEEPADE